MEFCIIGKTSKEPLSYHGRVLVHDNKAELEFLFPNERVAPLPKSFKSDLTMALKDHPDMEAVQFPLEQHMNQFRK